MTQLVWRLKEPFEVAAGDFVQVASRNETLRGSTDGLVPGTVYSNANKKNAMALPWPLISQSYRVHCRTATDGVTTWANDYITSPDSLTTEQAYPSTGFYALQCESVQRIYATPELVDSGDDSPTAAATAFWADSTIIWPQGVNPFTRNVSLITLDDAAPTTPVNTGKDACRAILVRSTDGPFTSPSTSDETASKPYDARYTGYDNGVSEWLFDTQPCQLCGHDLWYVPTYDTQGSAITGYDFIPHASSFKVMNLSWYDGDLYWSNLAGQYFAGLEVICWNTLRANPYLVCGANEPLSASTLYKIQWKAAPSLGIAGRPFFGLVDGPSAEARIGFIDDQEAYGASGWTNAWEFTTDGSGAFSGRVTQNGTLPTRGALIVLRIDLDTYAGSALFVDVFMQLEFDPTILPFAVPLANGGLLPGHG